MKKLLLLLLTSSSILSANAQLADKIVVNTEYSVNKLRQATPRRNIVEKTTAATSDWFNYYNQLATDKASYHFWKTYQDSSLYDSNPNAFSNPGVFGPGYMFLNGFGVSFDPTDSAFNHGYNRANPTIEPLAMVVTNNNSYEIDSLYINGKYVRNADFTDSLLLELVVVNNSVVTKPPADYSNNNTGAYLIQAPANYNFAASRDGMPRFANAIYDGPLNRLSNSITAPMRRLAIPLDLNAFTDTNSINGGRTFIFSISPALQVPAGAKVLAYAHFRSGNKYPAGTAIENANYFNFFSGDPVANAFPIQSLPNTTTGYPGSFQAGLIGDTYAAYDLPYWVPNRRMLVPTCQFAGAFGINAPDWGFHLKCNACSPLSIAESSNVITSNNPYPIPANEELYVPFTLRNSAEVNVTIRNAIGQIVKSQHLGIVAKGKAVFNTSNLPAGVYMYTITAQNQHATGRVIIAH